MRRPPRRPSCGFARRAWPPPTRRRPHAAEGAIGAYIHAGSRLGVIVEVNCETDFVARGDRFKELVADMAMQIAACPDIGISPDDVDLAAVEAERGADEDGGHALQAREHPREDRQGRLVKMVNEKALIKQDFIKDTTKTVEDIIKEATAGIGEKISSAATSSTTSVKAWRSARRTSRRRSRRRPRHRDKAAAKKEEPKEEEPKKEEEPAKPVVAISAKQVKNRDKTGAGMMDCRRRSASAATSRRPSCGFARRAWPPPTRRRPASPRKAPSRSTSTRFPPRCLVEVNCELTLPRRRPLQGARR